MEDNNVYVNIKLNTDGVKFGTKEVSNAIARTTQEMSRYGKAAQASCDSAANAFMRQNQAVANAAENVRKLEIELSKAKGKKNETSWLKDQFKMADDSLKELEKDLAQLQSDLSSQNKNFGVGSKQSNIVKENIDRVKQQIELEKNSKLEAMKDSRAYTSADTSAIEEKLAKEKQKLAAATNNASIAYEKFNNTVNKNKRSLLSFANITKLAHGSSKKLLTTNLDLGKTMKKGLTSILKYGFGIRSLYVAWRKLRSAMVEGFKTLATENPSFNSAISGITTQLNTLKNSFAAAFAPLVTIVAPIIESTLKKINSLMQAFSSLIAAMTGNKTFLAAKENQIDYAKSLDKTGNSADKSAKKQKKYMSALDEIATFTEKDSSSDSGSGNAFETLPVNSWAESMGEKIKSILDKIFDPLKKAWDSTGQKVIDAWKKALTNVKKLIGDIGRDFLKVWNEDKTIKIFEDILSIIADIGLVIANLAEKFDEAWNKNNIGLKILQSIRDIIGIIVSRIKNMADATVEWSEKLDFYPLLEGFNNFLESLKPIVDTVMGILEGFYTKVLLPLSEWVIEKGLPDLLNILADMNNNIDWEKILNAFNDLWDVIEPLAENVGEGLLWFLDNVISPLVEWAANDVIPAAIDLISTALDTLGTIADSIKPLLQAIWDNFFVPIRDYTWQAITDFLNGLVDAFKSFSTWAKDHKETIEDIASVVLGFMAGLWVYNTSKNMISFLGNLIAKFVELGGLKGMFTLLAGSINATALAMGAIFAAAMFWVMNWSDIKASFEGMENWQQATTVVLALAAAIAVLWVAISAGVAAASIVAGLALLGLGAGILAVGNSNKAKSQASESSASYALSNSKSAVRSSIPTKSVGKYSIPQLATGAVIPPNAPFLATLGDQKNGNNFEAPESLLRQVVREESGSRGGNYEFVAQINRKTLFDEMVSEAKLRQMTTGRNPFVIA